MHTTRYLLAWCAILTLGAARLSAQPGGPPPGAGNPNPGASYGYAPGNDGDGDFDSDDPLGLGIWDNDGSHHLSAFGSVDYLMFWSKAVRSPPLVATSPPGTAFGNAGVTPPAQVLLGGDASSFGGELRLGGRAMVGHWWDRQNWVGSMLRFTMLDDHNRDYDFAGTGGAPILGVPFIATNSAINPPPFQPAANVISFAEPGFQVDGTINVNSSSQFYTADALLRVMMVEGPSCRVDLITGYQFARIDSGLRIRTLQNFVIDPVLGNGAIITGTDDFGASNEFQGGSLGFTTDCRHGRWAFSALGKVSYGGMRQRMRIDGSSTVASPNFGTTTVAGSLFTQATNIGLYHRTMGAIAPEANLNLTYNFAPNLSLSTGYTFIYFSKVQTAGDAIDPVIDQPLFPNQPTRPLFAFHDNDFWAMGVNIGLNWDF